MVRYRRCSDLPMQYITPKRAGMAIGSARDRLRTTYEKGRTTHIVWQDTYRQFCNRCAYAIKGSGTVLLFSVHQATVSRPRIDAGPGGVQCINPWIFKCSLFASESAGKPRHCVLVASSSRAAQPHRHACFRRGRERTEITCYSRAYGLSPAPVLNLLPSLGARKTEAHAIAGKEETAGRMPDLACFSGACNRADRAPQSDRAPRSAAENLNRINDTSPNSSLMRELRSISLQPPTHLPSE